jgi:hypothetical protein
MDKQPTNAELRASYPDATSLSEAKRWRAQGKPPSPPETRLTRRLDDLRQALDAVFPSGADPDGASIPSPFTVLQQLRTEVAALEAERGALADKLGRTEQALWDESEHRNIVVERLHTAEIAHECIRKALAVLVREWKERADAELEALLTASWKE